MDAQMGELRTIRVQESGAELLELAARADLSGLTIRLGDGVCDVLRASAPETGRLTLLVEAAGRAAVPGGTVQLVDPELVPFAALTDVAARSEPDGAIALTGRLDLLAPRTSSTFPDLDVRGLPGELADAEVVVTQRLLLTEDIDVLRRTGDPEQHLVLLGLVGEGRPVPREVLVRGLRAAAAELSQQRGGDVHVRLLVLPAPASPGSVDLLTDLVARSGASSSWAVTSVDGRPQEGAPAVRELPAGPTSATWAEVLADLERGADLAEDVAPPAVAAELRRLHPASADRGVVLLLSGLSGSGKSTVAAGVVAALRREGSRTVTVLDGDRVRTMLSSGLSFSREDRELNVRRIGYVAAEVARHGGTAVCAPIAPYASTRAEVRRMVEEAGGAFVLVHVATPLDVCEARDRKGLYARARAGEIPAFTGVSDPYEVPVDAEVVVDTSTQGVRECVDAVVGALSRRGLVGAGTREVP